MRESMYNPHSIPMKPSPAPRFPLGGPTQHLKGMEQWIHETHLRPSETVVDSWAGGSYGVLHHWIDIDILLLSILLLLLYIYNQTYSMCISIYIYIHGTSPYIQFHSVIDQSMCLGYVYIYTTPVDIWCQQSWSGWIWADTTVRFGHFGVGGWTTQPNVASMSSLFAKTCSWLWDNCKVCGHHHQQHHHHHHHHHHHENLLRARQSNDEGM